MLNTFEPKIEQLRAMYAAFNDRDIDAALPTMTPDVAWPRAFKGGFVRGPEEVRAYWTEQWAEIDPHVEPVSFHPNDDGQILERCLLMFTSGTCLALRRVWFPEWKSALLHLLTDLSANFQTTHQGVFH
jgi:hypothetical protein